MCSKHCCVSCQLSGVSVLEVHQGPVPVSSMFCIMDLPWLISYMLLHRFSTSLCIDQLSDGPLPVGRDCWGLAFSADEFKLGFWYCLVWKIPDIAYGRKLSGTSVFPKPAGFKTMAWNSLLFYIQSMPVCMHIWSGHFAYESRENLFLTNFTELDGFCKLLLPYCQKDLHEI